MKKIISKDGTSIAFDQDMHRFGRDLNAVRPQTLCVFATCQKIYKSI